MCNIKKKLFYKINRFMVFFCKHAKFSANLNLAHAGRNLRKSFVQDGLLRVVNFFKSISAVRNDAKTLFYHFSKQFKCCLSIKHSPRYT